MEALQQELKLAGGPCTPLSPLLSQSLSSSSSSEADLRRFLENSRGEFEALQTQLAYFAEANMTSGGEFIEAGCSDIGQQKCRTGELERIIERRLGALCGADNADVDWELKIADMVQMQPNH